MKKPEPVIRKYLPYHEIREWIEHKHGKNLDDWGYSPDGDGQPYLCFWHTLVDFHMGEPQFIPMYPQPRIDKPWHVEILSLVRGEFEEYYDGTDLWID